MHQFCAFSTMPENYPNLKAHEFILQVNKQKCVFCTEKKVAV